MAGDDEDDFTLEGEEGDEGQDAGLLDDEGGDEAQTGQKSPDAEGEEGVEAQPQGRRDRRIQTLNAQLKAEADHRARVERELAELRAQSQRPAQPREESEEEFQARLSLLSTEERIEARLARSERKHQQELQQLRIQSWDAADRSAYDARAVVDTRYDKYKNEVEAFRQQHGLNIPRQAALEIILGRKVLENRGKVGAAREQGQRNIQRQQARTTPAASDRGAQRSRRFAANDMSPEAVAARLQDVVI